MITLYIFVSKSVKAISDRRKLLPEEALYLSLAAGQQLVCVPGLATAAPAQPPLGLMRLQLLRSNEKRSTDTGLRHLLFPSQILETVLPFDSFWKWSIIRARGRCNLVRFASNRLVCIRGIGGVCCVASVVTGCNTWQDVSLLTQLCCILTEDREYRMVL